MRALSRAVSPVLELVFPSPLGHLFLSWQKHLLVSKLKLSCVSAQPGMWKAVLRNTAPAGAKLLGLEWTAFVINLHSAFFNSPRRYKTECFTRPARRMESDLPRGALCWRLWEHPLSPSPSQVFLWLTIPGTFDKREGRNLCVYNGFLCGCKWRDILWHGWANTCSSSDSQRKLNGLMIYVLAKT